MLQICDIEQRALLPFRRKACWGFFLPEKSDGFGWVWACELGYQRPELYTKMYPALGDSISFLAQCLIWICLVMSKYIYSNSWPSSCRTCGLEEGWRLVPYPRETTHTFAPPMWTYRLWGPATPSSICTATAFQAQENGWGLKLRRRGVTPSLLMFSFPGAQLSTGITLSYF